MKFRKNIRQRINMGGLKSWPAMRKHMTMWVEIFQWSCVVLDMGMKRRKGMKRHFLGTKLCVPPYVWLSKNEREANGCHLMSLHTLISECKCVGKK